MKRSTALAILLLAALALPAARCTPLVVVVQEIVEIPGFVEPHTPGSGAPEELPLPAAGRIEQLLGTSPDLNRVAYVRTRTAEASDPRIIVVLIPGFLGGSGNFDPIARDLVRRFDGRMEVWAMDRRSSQVEDRRGALHARATVEAATDDDGIFQGLSEGVRFYFPDSDTDGSGEPDGPFPLPDAIPGDGPSDFQRLEQDDLRFAAHWGVDTYVRDWREVVLRARDVVGDDGLVIFGGHSMGTSWTGIFAAYDFDPGPGVEAGYELVDGLLLLEGGGSRGPSTNAPDLDTYEAAIDDLENGTDVVLGPPGANNPLGDGSIFLESLNGLVDARDLGAAGDLNGLAGISAPDEPSILATTPLFGGFPVAVLLQAPMTNRSLMGFFLDDEFSANPAFTASFGFSANGSNLFNPFAALLPGDFYVAIAEGVTRTWINFDSPRFDPADADPLTCPPLDPEPAVVGLTGCAIVDNGPKPGPTDPPRRWGVEREVTDVDVLARSLYETANASEWYFISGRPGLDLQFGHDASALGAPELLNTTQNAFVDLPVLGIGGSNGLAPTERSFESYLASIASVDTEVVILEGYAHVDVLTAADNEAVPAIADWVSRIQRDKLLAP